MFDIGGIPIAPLLEAWLRCETNDSTRQFVEATYWNFWKDKSYSNAFASERPAFKDEIRTWLLDPVHQQRFLAKLMAPAFLAGVAHQPATGHMTFSTMVDGVFDELTG